MTPYFRQYLETALWSSTDDDDNPLDRKYSILDIDRVSLHEQEVQLERFMNQAAILAPSLYEYDLTDIAHDFWLTRNRHGAGFWDGDYNESVGELLTALSHRFGECDLYVGDNGKLYFEMG